MLSVKASASVVTSIVLFASVALLGRVVLAQDSKVAGDGSAKATKTEGSKEGSAPAEHATHEKSADAKGHDAHGGHDPTDLSDANATPKIVDPADLRFDMSVYTAIVFLL